MDDGRDDGWVMADRIGRANSRQKTRPPVTTLTEREYEILLTCARYGAQEAATELGISAQTAKNTLTHVYRKLGVRGIGAALLVVLAGERP